MSETVGAIVAAHRKGTLSPARTVARSYSRIRNVNDPAIFITLRDEKEALLEAENLNARDAQDLPLFGVPIAVKDNIDVEKARRHADLLWIEQPDCDLKGFSEKATLWIVTPSL